MKIPQTPPPITELLERGRENISTLFGAGAAPGGKYRHWDTHRRIKPEDGLTVEDTWLAMKLARLSQAKAVSFLDQTGHPFRYCLPDPAQAMLHRIDRDAGGQIGLGEDVINPGERNRYIINSLIHEAITSSQLEGASTTSSVARDLIRSGRQPKTRSERMILNNYLAMHFVRDHVKEPLTPALILQIHKTVSANTLDDPRKEGTLRVEQDETAVTDGKGRVLHDPPAADTLPARLNALCVFANDTNGSNFIHPVVRAIIIHFWLGYDHPFVDGNGRTARALFYWSMLSQGYWMFEFVSISHILRGAPTKYARSFLYTETDDNDLTYFVLYQLSIIDRALDELQGYLHRKIEQVRTAEARFKQTKLNHRQLALLSHALRHPTALYTVRSHRMSHHVTHQTARTDLQGLVRKGLLVQKEVGNVHVFEPSAEVTREQSSPRHQ